MPIDFRQFERDFEAFEMSVPKNYDPLRVAINSQLALERYKINEEARAKAQVKENNFGWFMWGFFAGIAIMYLVGHLNGFI